VYFKFILKIFRCEIQTEAMMTTTSSFPNKETFPHRYITQGGGGMKQHPPGKFSKNLLTKMK
jgi:hypothetical protein